MSLSKANQTSFTTGWSGTKICSKCSCQFTATSGSQQKCSACRKCRECGTQLRYSHRTFCNSSCKGKYGYRHNSKIKENMAKGKKFAYTPEAVEKRASKRRGKPNLKLRGENNPNWSGGVGRQERHTLMGRIEYINWRKEVFKRDNYTCQLCSKVGGDLEADHIIPYFIDKDKVLDLDNGRTLCKPYHKTTDSWGHKVKTVYRQSLEKK